MKTIFYFPLIILSMNLASSIVKVKWLSRRNLSPQEDLKMGEQK